MKQAGISIIIPAWNEEDRIGPTLDGYLRFLESLERESEIIVVMDGVNDGTQQVVDHFVGNGVRKLVFPKKMGKGGAVMAGFEASKHPYVGYLDADGAVPPRELAMMVHLLEDYDCVVGSRWIKGSKVIQKEPFLKTLAGRVYNLLVRSLLSLPLHDTQCGAKFIHRDLALEASNSVKVNNIGFEASLLYHIRDKGGRIKEVPIEWAHDHRSRLHMMVVVPVMLFSLLGVWIMNSPLRKVIPEKLVEALATRLGTL